MNHRQNDPGADDVRAKFTAWLEVVIKHAKLDYVRKLKRQPDFLSLEDIPENYMVVEEPESVWLREFREPNPYDFEEERLAKAVKLFASICAQPKMYCVEKAAFPPFGRW